MKSILRSMRWSALLLCSLPGEAGASAPARISVAIATRSPGAGIADDFAGLSFEMTDVLPAKDGRHRFAPDNAALAALFRQLGIRSLRVGGNTADKPAVPLPSPADIDSLFAFARSVGARVIFTLRLRESDTTAAARVARCVMDRSGGELACFAIGNEPNVYAKTYAGYVDLLKTYMAAVMAPGVAPGARFCGPSTTPSKAAWARDLAKDFGNQGPLVLITQHEYPGGNARKVTDPSAARDSMLSPEWVRAYEAIHQSFVPSAVANGLPYRLEETNSFYNGGAKDVSNTLASALWGLDYLHWWAAHGAQGLNFHTGDHVAAGEDLTTCWYTPFRTASPGYEVAPLGYALKAFSLGGHGRIVPASVSADGRGANVTAYGVLQADGSLFVTLINKEHGRAERSFEADLRTDRRYARGTIMRLSASGSDAAATSGVTFGGASIDRNGSWEGSGADLAPPGPDGEFAVDLPAASAAVLHLASD